MKRIVAGVLTVALMGLLLWTGMRRQEGGGSVPGMGGSTAPDPAEARLATLLDRAGRGDVSGYLDCFGGPLRERLEREVGERGRDTFAADLVGAARSRKSHAVFAVEPEGEAAARITVETVYPDRNERQTYHLAQAGGSGSWLVNDVETVRSQVPAAKFGTAASYQEPEGVPVQGVPLRVETGPDDGTVAGDASGPNP